MWYKLWAVALGIFFIMVDVGHIGFHHDWVTLVVQARIFGIYDTWLSNIIFQLKNISWCRLQARLLADILSLPTHRKMHIFGVGLFLIRMGWNIIIALTFNINMLCFLRKDLIWAVSGKFSGIWVLHLPDQTVLKKMNISIWKWNLRYHL